MVYLCHLPAGRGRHVEPFPWMGALANRSWPTSLHVSPCRLRRRRLASGHRARNGAHVLPEPGCDSRPVLRRSAVPSFRLVLPLATGGIAPNWNCRKDYRGKRVWLNFDGINHKADILVNGAPVGKMAGAFLRGRFDVTEQGRRRPQELPCRADSSHAQGPASRSIKRLDQMFLGRLLYPATRRPSSNRPPGTGCPRSAIGTSVSVTGCSSAPAAT